MLTVFGVLVLSSGASQLHMAVHSLKAHFCWVTLMIGKLLGQECGAQGPATRVAIHPMVHGVILQGLFRNEKTSTFQKAQSGLNQKVVTRLTWMSFEWV